MNIQRIHHVAYVLGPTDHTLFKSIDFFDPNGHRIELAADCGTPEMYRKLDAAKWERTAACALDARWQHVEVRRTDEHLE